MKKIKLKGTLQPYVDYDSLKTNLKIKIKKSFSEEILNNLALRIIKDFEDITLKETLQIKSYEENIKNLKTDIKNLEREVLIFRSFSFGLVIIVILFLVFKYVLNFINLASLC